jgi:hypothetical protein
MRPTITLQLKLGLLGLCLLFAAFIPRGDDPVDKLATVLQRWTDSIPQEKVYLQTDKPYYVLGDTIWFKSYVTIGSRHQLSALSGSLYVDLINEKDSIIRALKLPITGGMAIGNFILGDDYKQGSYRIRSYTQWMRNAGDEYFYDHTFTVGDLVSNNIVVKADYGYKQTDGKTILSAMLNYAGDDGKPIAGKDIHYQVVIDKQVVWARSATTDASGNIPVNIPNDKQANLAGAYIHTTLDGNDKHTIVRDFPIKAYLAQSDVQFFPESGNLVNGLSSHIAFKAVGVDGLGIDIKGKIVDEAGTEVADIVTLHAGMGSFLLRPQAGKTYTANISFADGTTKAIPLPKANDEGMVLNVYQPSRDSVLVRINASKSQLQSSVGFIAHTNGETVFASTIKLTSPTTSIWLDKKAFPTGIAQFTLFNNSGEPLNERIAFIRSSDILNLDLKTIKNTYSSKEHIKMDLTANDGKGKPTAGNFSVAVIDESKVPVDETSESTIFSNLLLTSDLKGYVEKPNYYFVTPTEETDKALDNLMLTQGYRRFTWKELNKIANSKPVFPAEGLGVTISGRVTKLNDKPLSEAIVNLVSVKARVDKTISADANGRFKFDEILMTDGIKFTVQAKNGSSDKAKLILDSIPLLKISSNRNMADVSTNINGTLKAYLDNGKKEDDTYEKLGQLDKVHRLREVNIRAKKTEAQSYAVQGPLKISEGQADKTVVLQNTENYSRLIDCLSGLSLGNVRLQSGFPYALTLKTEPPSYVAMRIILDGVLLSEEDAQDVMNGTSLNPIDVVKIDVVNKNMALMTSLVGIDEPALLIYTNRDLMRKPNYKPNVANVTPKGFNKVREFYSTRYDKPSNAASQPDLRTTVYWNPYLKTDGTGRTSFNFFNTDGPGTYRVVVEGVNADGQLGRKVFRYTVDGNKINNSLAISGSMAVSGKALVPITASVNTDKNLSLITTPLDSMNKHLPIEKVYLHTDKPYYNIGDTLWFKSYLLDRVSLADSRVSNLLYVELDNDSSEMVRRISIPIKDGLGWAQIPLPGAIFREGGYTLRAYTNWMQNFGEDYVFSQRFYLGVPTNQAWLVKSSSVINRVDDKDQLQVDIKLMRADKLSTPIALKKVKIKLYEGRYFITEETLTTSADGGLSFTERLKEKKDGRNIRAQITSLDPVDRGKIVQVPLVIRRNQNIDLQFLPEGGKLVAGLRSVVGFKALGEDGKGASVAGSLYDSKGTVITTFADTHNGMGALEFVPQLGEVYSAKLDKPKWAAKTYTLPAVNAMGTVLHVDNKENSDDLVVGLTGLNSLPADSACYLVGTSRGIMYYSQKLEPTSSNLTVSKKLFPSGIAKFTLFKGKRPLNERAVFIDNHDQLAISITPDKATYGKRDSVSLAIEVKDKSGSPVQGSFSLSVTDDSQVKPDSLNNNGIAASLLLSSELKGHIESPGYYINRKDKTAWQALDNLLLTQGWTGYDWKDVFAPVNPAKFEAEKEFKVTGRVSNLTNKPVPNASVAISSEKPQFTKTTITDANGLYTFKNLPVIDSGYFTLKTTNSNGNKLIFGNVSVNKFTAPIVPSTLRDPIMPWNINTDSTQLNYVKRVNEKANFDDYKLTGNVLKQVNIKGRKIIPGVFFLLPDGANYAVYTEQLVKESAVTNIYELIQQKLSGARVVQVHDLPSLMVRDQMLDVYVDNMPLPVETYSSPRVDDLVEELSSFPIANLKGMNISVSPPASFVSTSSYWSILNEAKLRSEGSLQYLYDRARVTSGLSISYINLFTKDGKGWVRKATPDAVTYRPLPVMYPQQFYSPKYKVDDTPVKEPDYRSTLYWQPDIFTDQNGKAKVMFYTSDIKDKFTVKISGIDAAGGIGDNSIKLNDLKDDIK